MGIGKKSDSSKPPQALALRKVAILREEKQFLCL